MIRERIRGVSDAIELRSPAQARDVTGPILFHSELSIVAPWEGAEIRQLNSLAKWAQGRLQAASFHVLSRYHKNDIEDGAFVGRGKPMGAAKMEDTAAVNVRAVREILGSEVPLLLENNNHLGTDAYDVVTDPDFLSSLMMRLDLRLLLDIAHARITARTTGSDEKKYISALPLESTLQVHLSRHQERNAGGFDTHDALEDEDFAYFVDLLPQLPHLEYATIEFYQGADMLVRQLGRLSKLLNTIKK